MPKEGNHIENKHQNLMKEKIWFFLKDIGFGYLWIAFISLLIMQDMYVATQIFSIPLGLFLENYLYCLSNINFLVLIALLPFVYGVIIFYIPRLSDKIAHSLWESCKCTSTSIFLYFLFFTALQIYYFSILEFLNYFSFVKFLYSNLYIGLMPLIIIISIFNGFVLYYRVKLIVYIGIAITVFLVAVWISSQKLLIIGILSVLLYSISQIYHLPYTENTKVDSRKFFSISLLFIFIFSYVIIGITYINYDEWKMKKFTTNPTFGIINKAFFVNNQKDISIDDSDVNDYNLTKIDHSSDGNHVVYIPISPSMRWYFADHNSSKISVYGVEEKTSTSDPSKSWHILKFVADYNITENKQ